MECEEIGKMEKMWKIRRKSDGLYVGRSNWRGMRPFTKQGRKYGSEQGARQALRKMPRLNPEDFEIVECALDS